RNNPICETLTNLPVKFDIEKLVAEFKPTFQKEDVKELKSPRDFLSVPDNNWVVLPMFKLHLDHLKPSLSVRTNKYMRCRYRNFLDNVPDSYVNIVVHDSNLSKQPYPRRKSLTGQFYGVDFKLAPVPASADPRSPLGAR
ncbi:hypothetical protein KR044_009239, partial [Drosophila immigrans]